MELTFRGLSTDTNYVMWKIRQKFAWNCEQNGEFWIWILGKNCYAISHWNKNSSNRLIWRYLAVGQLQFDEKNSEKVSQWNYSSKHNVLTRFMCWQLQIGGRKTNDFQWMCFGLKNEELFWAKINDDVDTYDVVTEFDVKKAQFSWNIPPQKIDSESFIEIICQNTMLFRYLAWQLQEVLDLEPGKSYAKSHWNKNSSK